MRPVYPELVMLSDFEFQTSPGTFVFVHKIGLKVKSQNYYLKYLGREKGKDLAQSYDKHR